MSVLTDLASVLTAAEVTPVFRGGRPATPDACVTLQSYLGDPNRAFSDTGVPAIEQHNIQVVARAANQGAAETLAKAAFDAIQFPFKLINGSRYTHCRANQNPAFIGVDANDRPLIAFNVRLTKLRSAGLELETEQA